MKDKTFARRMTIICSLGMVVTLLIAAVYAAAQIEVVSQDPFFETSSAFKISVSPHVGASAPQFDDITRTRYIMSLIRGEFNPDTGNLVLISLSNANKWAEAFYVAYGPITDANGEPLAWSSLTADQKGRYYLRQLRRYHIEVKRGVDVPLAVNSATATANAAVDASAAIFPEIPE